MGYYIVDGIQVEKSCIGIKKNGIFVMIEIPQHIIYYMKIINLPDDRSTDSDPKVQKLVSKLITVIEELNKKEMPDDTIHLLNAKLETLLNIAPQNGGYVKAIKSTMHQMLETVREKHQIITKNYYRNYWMPLGMCIFGVPIGCSFGLMADNMALMGTMLPVGLVLGMAYGSYLDKQAIAANRVIDLEIE